MVHRPGIRTAVRLLLLMALLWLLIDLELVRSVLREPLGRLGPWADTALAPHPRWSGWAAGALLAVMLAIYLASVAWYELWFRYLAWSVSRRLGSLRTDPRVAAGTQWARRLLLLALLVVALHLVEQSRPQADARAPDRACITDLAGCLADAPYQLLRIDFLLAVLATAVLLLLAYRVYRARQRIVILPFRNQTGDPQLDPAVAGLGTLLLERLTALRRLYATIDEMRPSSGAGGAIDVTTRVEDTGEVLQGAISAGSNIGVGPVQISIGGILELWARLFRGPGIGGSLHRHAGGMVLVASLSGRRMSYAWRVEGAEPGAEAAGQAPVRAMIEQLAHQVFTDLVHVGSERWQAARLYSEALELYRDARLSAQERILKFRRAEQAFRRAYAEDQTFAQCFYNLGIVYRDLGQAESAEVFLRKCLEQEPDHPDAQYALALISSQRDDHQDVIGACERLLRVRPSDARAWNLKGLSERRLRNELSAFAASRKTATALAWRDLCVAALRGASENELRTPKDEARQITLNLAVGYASVSADLRAWLQFRQAAWLDREHPLAFFEFGKVVFDDVLGSRRLTPFIKRLRLDNLVLRRGLRLLAAVDPGRLLPRDRIVYWQLVRFGRSQTKAAPEDAKAAWAELLLSTIRQRPEDFSSHLFPAAEGEILAGAAQIERLRAAAARARFEAILKSLDDLPEGAPREQLLAILVAERAKHVLYQPEPASPADAKAAADDVLDLRQGLRQAIDALEQRSGPSYKRVIREQSLHPLLASVCVREARLRALPQGLRPPDPSDEAAHFIEALEHARRAVAANPIGAYEHLVLAEVYAALDDNERAEAALRHALDLGFDPDTVIRIGITYFARAVGIRSRTQRRAALLQFVLLYEKALSLLEAQAQAPDPTELGHLYYDLGRAYREILDLDRAARSFTLAWKAGFKPLQVRAEIGGLLIDLKAYTEAEDILRAACRDLRRHRRSGAPPDLPVAALTGEDLPLAALEAFAYLFRACAFAERGAFPARALTLVRHAERLIPAVRARELRQRLLAYHFHCRARIRALAASGTAPAATRLNGAIEDLERSVALDPDPDAFVHLAEALIERNRKGDGQRARRALELAESQDLRGALDATIASLKTRCSPGSPVGLTQRPM